MNLQNFKFDSRLNGIDKNGNVIRGKKKKKKRSRFNPAEERRREELNDENGIMRFSLNGIYYESPDDDYEEEDDVEEVTNYQELDNRHNKNKNREKNNRNNNDDNNSNGNKDKASTIDDAIEELTQFVTTYSNNKINTPIVKSIVANGFASVANIMSHYNDDSWKKALPAMNKVIILMSSESFSRILKIVLSEGIMVTTKTTKEDMMRLFNLALDYNIDKMSNDVIYTYIDIISTMVADIDIKLMMETYGMDEDTAINFVVAIPISVTGVKNDADIKQYARRFIEEVLRESESTIRYMNSECQKKLFYNIFNDKKDLGAMKAVGQCMTATDIVLPEEVNEDGTTGVDPKKEELVKQYIKALYEIMDDHDIPTIQMVLKFIVKELKKRDEANNEEDIVFDVDTALEYDNIRKAILDLAKNNDDARYYFDDDGE